MDLKQVVLQTVEESVSNPPDASQGGHTDEDVHTSPNLAGDAVTLVVQTCSGSVGVDELEARTEGLLPSIAPGGLQGEVHAVPPPSDYHVPTNGNPVISQKSLQGPSITIEQEIETSAGNPITLVGNVANTAAISSTKDIKGKAQVLVLARLRSIVFVYAAKLPIVGSYFADTKLADEPNVNTIATETTPLLGALHDPKAFATKQAEGLLRRLLSPLLSRLPDVDALDNVESDNYGPFFMILVECYVLAKDGGGWLL